MRTVFATVGVAMALLTSAGQAVADTAEDRFSAAGYFRVMARPDLQGGDGRLGFSNFYGRLLNEGSFASLELRLALLKQDPTSNEVWTRVHARVEGGSVNGADIANGSLERFRLTRLYALAGNILLEDVTWQLGTLENFFGDLGLYDFRPSTIFNDTVGLSARYNKGPLELLAGIGDAGFSLRGDQYSTIVSAGGSARYRILPQLEVGVAGQYYFEPEVAGNRFAPYYTPGVDYEDFIRGEVVQSYIEDNPGMEDLFDRNNAPIATESTSYRAIGYLGFGGFGPLLWNSLYVNFTQLHPRNFVTENFQGRDYTIYVNELTDEKTRFEIGNEMQLRLIPNRLDLVWAAYYLYQKDNDNQISATEDDRTVMSTVARAQFYLTPTTHLLAETSLANEKIHNGNLFRSSIDSVFSSTEGIDDPRGLEFGDLDERRTWQGKIGWVLNPLGYGVYTRPSLRILYGVQHSNQNNAFGNNFVDSLDEFQNNFPNKEQHLHHLLALEVEAWF